MKILGIDPGMAIVGYGMIEVDNNTMKLITSGSIQTDKKLDDSKRLLEIYNDLSQIVERYKPDCASVEQLFLCFFNCKDSSLMLGMTNKKVLSREKQLVVILRELAT